MIARPAIAWFAAASLAMALSSGVAAQDLPESLKNRALSIRIEAIILPPVAAKGGAESASAQEPWHQESTGLTVPGTPVGIKLVASNVVILVQVTPFDRDDSHLTLVVQGQVWVRNGDGGLSFRTTVDKIELGYGETVFFYPLGRAAGDKPSLRVSIAVDKSPSAGATRPAAPALDASSGKSGK